jgi:hypothetical protein
LVLLRSEKQLFKEIDKLIDRVDKKMEKYDRLDRERFNEVLAYLVVPEKPKKVTRVKLLSEERQC